MPPFQQNQPPSLAATQQQGAPVTTTVRNLLGPSCLNAAIDCTGGVEDVGTVMRRELQMQLVSENDWRGFKADILPSLVLQIFGYMSADSPFVIMLHSCARYSGFRGKSDLVGKVVGFAGDFNQYGVVPAMQFLTPEVP